MIYRHDQIGRGYAQMIVLATVAGVAFLIWSVTAGYVPIPYVWLFALPILIFALGSLAFIRLTIGVDAAGVRWSMTFGFPRGYIPMEEIVSVDIVPVSFWSGIGIHLTLRGWVWNVALGRGVQIHRCDGMPIVLGTDEPEALVAAIGRGRSG